MKTTAKIFVFIGITLVIFGIITYSEQITIKKSLSRAPAAEEAYFINDVFTDEQPQGKTVRDMVKHCESADAALKAAAQPAQPVLNEEAGICVGSIRTFAKVKFPGKICLPAHNLTTAQAIEIFLKWAQNNPAKLEYNFTVGYLEALEAAFPCKTQK